MVEVNWSEPGEKPGQNHLQVDDGLSLLWLEKKLACAGLELTAITMFQASHLGDEVQLHVHMYIHVLVVTYMYLSSHHHVLL